MKVGERVNAKKKEMTLPSPFEGGGDDVGTQAHYAILPKW